jgi:hypothetical protein
VSRWQRHIANPNKKVTTMVTTVTTASPARRPPVVTLLALCNFILAALFGIGLVAYFGRMRLIPLVESHSPSLSATELKQGEAMLSLGITPYYVLGVAMVILSVLMIVSGIGYLYLKKFEGKTLGNVAALLSIATALAVTFWVPAVLDGGINGFSVINYSYPLLTLFLLNRTYKDQFVN